MAEPSNDDEREAIPEVAIGPMAARWLSACTRMAARALAVAGGLLLLASPASAFTNCQVSVANVGFLLDACTRGNTSLCSFLPQARERQGEICISPFGMETFPATVARPLRQFMPHESARPVPGYSVQMGAPLP